ncbi:MAG: hypothetical protein HY880_06440 [Deltaproteobacteria bacterium]|nr:hypothetical protein [Deltaproteobacteria bacterium]
MAVQRITGDELKKKLERGEDIIILDVRNPVDYGKSRVKIKGAQRTMVSEISKQARGFDRKKTVVAYCT